jgi:hypothetical protein
MRNRRATAIFLPGAILATALCGLIYVVVQQDLRSGADSPQEQLAEDAAARLEAGAAPSDIVATAKVDIGHSLAPFVVVYDPAGSVVATDGQLDGRPPAVPLGVLATATANGRNAVTWQPRSGVRVATVTVPWSGGTVLAGRSLRLVEDSETRFELLVAAGWIATLVALAVGSLVGGRLWPGGADGPS